MKRLISIMVLFSALNAVLNISGSTGYITMPTGDGLRFQEYSTGMQAFGKTKLINSHWKYTASLGTADGIELGFMGRSEREGVFVNAKFFGELSTMRDPLLVAMGFENLSSLGTLGDYPSLYMVTTKKFYNGSSFSIGFIGKYINKELKVSALFGTEIFTSDTLSWVFDLNGVEDNKYNLNAGVRLYGNSNMVFNCYVINAARNEVDRDVNPTIVTLGMSITNFM